MVTTLWSCDAAHRHDTGEHRAVIHQHGASAALAFPAAELGARQAQVFAQHFEQGPLGVGVHAARFSIDRKSDCRHRDLMRL